jgi:hypothetical protein
MTPVQIDDDSNGHCRLCCSDRDDKNGKEDPIQLFWIQVLIEHYKIDIYAIEDKFNCHQHGDHVATCKQSVHADKE